MKSKSDNPVDPKGTPEGEVGSGVPKFTPGPWEVGELDRGFGRGSLCVQDQHGFIAKMPGDHLWSESLANAHLIAAAPDLYEALRGCMAACELQGADSAEFFDARNSAYAALAKARGEKNAD